MTNSTKTFTRKELEQYTGKDGARAYVAFEGKVYDVTDSPFWIDGDHEGAHVAGRDLTEELADAPHGDEVLETYTVVGALSDG